LIYLKNNVEHILLINFLTDSVMKNNIIIYALNSVFYYLSSNQRRQAVVQFVLLLVSSALDICGLASLIPVLLMAAEPKGVQSSHFFSSIYELLNFSSEKTFIVFLIGVLFVFFLLKNAFSIWINYLQARFSATVGLDIVRQQLHKYLHLPFWEFTNYGSANLINSALQVPNNYVNGVLRPLFLFLSELTVIIVITVAILVYKPLLIAVLAFVLLPTTLLTYKGLRTRSQTIGNRLNKLRPISYATVGDLFSGFVELKLAGQQDRFANRLLKNQEDMQDLDAESYLYGMVPVRIIEMVAIIGVLTIFLYSLFGPAGSGGLITLVGLFAAAAYRLMPSINRLLVSMVAIKSNSYTIDNLQLFRESSFDETLPQEQLPLSFKKDLVLQEISFRFPSQEAHEKPALQHINLRVNRGEKIGFIGASGSGKTTLMNLLLRFYREQHGQILIDGQLMTRQHLKAWYKLVGYVKQDTFLMEASIQDNITLGAPAAEVDEERLRYAIEQASLSNFIAELPEGVNTFIGERGSKLSGGQRQRIGIARALYKQAEILLLDEATSALDNETEREVNAAITRLAHTNITILIIAHRLTTLRECDRIYEMRDGTVIAERKYAELIH
jgi:ABC-type multidrug transport system fused ATPase/permease subunit